MDGMVGDTAEHVGEISLRIDAVHAACFENGVEACGPLSAGVGATKEVIFTAQSN